MVQIRRQSISVVKNERHQSVQAERAQAAHDDYFDVIERGIVDSVKVARTALQNAISREFP